DWVPSSDLLSEAARPRLKIARGDVRSQATLERILGEYEIDTVIHLAAQTIVGIANRNPVSTFETNIRGTWALLEACRRSPKVKQIVVASSDKAYGSQEKLPYDDAMPLHASTPTTCATTSMSRMAPPPICCLRKRSRATRSCAARPSISRTRVRFPSWIWSRKSCST